MTKAVMQIRAADLESDSSAPSRVELRRLAISMSEIKAEFYTVSTDLTRTDGTLDIYVSVHGTTPRHHTFL